MSDRDIGIYNLLAVEGEYIFVPFLRLLDGLAMLYSSDRSFV